MHPSIRSFIHSFSYQRIKEINVKLIYPNELPTDLSASSFNEYDSRVTVADAKSGQPNKMQPLPQSLIFDMRWRRISPIKRNGSILIWIENSLDLKSYRITKLLFRLLLLLSNNQLILIELNVAVFFGLAFQTYS